MCVFSGAIRSNVPFPIRIITALIQVYSVTIMTHVKELEAGKSSQWTSRPITPVSNHLQGGIT